MAAAACLAICLAPGGRAAADDSDTHLQVTVNGEPVAVEATLNTAGYDVANRSYTVCDSNGNTRTVTVSGWSVSAVMTAAGVTPDQVSSISVPRIASSGSVVLHPGDFGPMSFQDGPALVESRTSMGGVSTADDFLRPFRGTSCASDPNADDYVITPVDTPLSVQIASGTQLQVSDSVDHASVAAGTDATFTAEVSGATAGENLIYRWQFGDGSLGSGPTVAHAFAGAGSYKVLLTVDSGAAAGGAAAPLTVTVGSAAGPAGAGRTPAPTRTRPGVTAKTGAPARTASAPRTPSTSPASRLPVPTVTAPAVQGPSVAAPTTSARAATPPATSAVGSPPPTVAPTPVIAPPGQFVAGRAISLLAPVGAPAAPSTPSTDSPRAALQQALGPHGTTAPSGSHDWAPFGAVGGFALCLAVGAGFEIRATRRVRR